MDGNPKPSADFRWLHHTGSSPTNITSFELHPFVYSSVYTLNNISASYCGRILETTIKNRLGASTEATKLTMMCRFIYIYIPSHITCLAIFLIVSNNYLTGSYSNHKCSIFLSIQLFQKGFIVSLMFCVLIILRCLLSIAFLLIRSIKCYPTMNGPPIRFFRSFSLSHNAHTNQYQLLKSMKFAIEEQMRKTIGSYMQILHVHSLPILFYF